MTDELIKPKERLFYIHNECDYNRVHIDKSAIEDMIRDEFWSDYHEIKLFNRLVETVDELADRCSKESIYPEVMQYAVSYLFRVAFDNAVPTRLLISITENSDSQEEIKKCIDDALIKIKEHLELRAKLNGL